MNTHYDRRTLRRLQELAAELDKGWHMFASDEGGESRGLPVRVQINDDEDATDVMVQVVTTP
jgi:hypothetical protein